MEERIIDIEKRRLSKEEKEKEICEQIKLLVKLFLRTNESDINLAKATKMSSSTVGRRLIDGDRIIAVFNKLENKIDGFDLPDDYDSYGEYIFDVVKQRRRENLLEAKRKGGKTSIAKYGYGKDELGKFNFKMDLSKLYSTEEKQLAFLRQAALTFRLSLQTLSELVGIPEDELHRKLTQGNNSAYYESFKYLFEVDYSTDQANARAEFITLYKDILSALKERNKEKLVSLLNVINDSEAKKVLEYCKKRVPNSTVSDDKLMVILKYQLKYAMSYRGVCQKFNISPVQYNIRILEILETEPELKLQYEHLADYNKYLGGRK